MNILKIFLIIIGLAVLGYYAYWFFYILAALLLILLVNVIYNPSLQKKPGPPTCPRCKSRRYTVISKPGKWHGQDFSLRAIKNRYDYHCLNCAKEWTKSN